MQSTLLFFHWNDPTKKISHKDILTTRFIAAANAILKFYHVMQNSTYFPPKIWAQKKE